MTAAEADLLSEILERACAAGLIADLEVALYRAVAATGASVYEDAAFLEACARASSVLCCRVRPEELQITLTHPPFMVVLPDVGCPSTGAESEGRERSDDRCNSMGERSDD